MSEVRYRFRARLWVYPGAAGWHFVSLPKGVSREIRDMAGGTRRGWGSVRVRVTVGETSWQTSVFPHRESAAFILPVKAQVRGAEGLVAGQPVDVSIAVQA